MYQFNINQFTKSTFNEFSNLNSTTLAISSLLRHQAQQSQNSMMCTPKSTRKKNNTSFQDLKLFFNEVEILHQFKVYCTQTSSFFFTLKKSQVDLVKQSKKSIFLRFCHFEPSKIRQTDNLPKNVNILINGCVLCLDSKKICTKWKSPIDVTSKCRIVTTRNANSFDININDAKKLMKKGYGIEVVLAKKLSINETLELLKTDSFQRKSTYTLKIIKDSCSGFEDMTVDKIKVPLNCPVTKKIIDLPLVGLKCKHVACFEAQTFLEMHLNKQEWICPVCYNLIRKDELVRDPLIEDILESTQRQVEQIEFDQLGNFKVSDPVKEKSSSQKSKKKIEYITIDDEFSDNSTTDHANKVSSKKIKLEKFNKNFDNLNSLNSNLESTFIANSHSNNIFNQSNGINPLSTNNSFFRLSSQNCTLASSTIIPTSTFIHHVNDVDLIFLSDESVIVLDSEPEDVNDSNDSNISPLLFSLNCKQANKRHRSNDGSNDSSTDENNELTDTDINSDNDSDRTELDAEHNINHHNSSHSSSNNSHYNSGDNETNSESDNESDNESDDENSYDGDDDEGEDENSNLSSISSASTLRTDSSSSNDSNQSSDSSSNSSNNSTRKNELNSSNASSTLLSSRNSLRRRRKRRRFSDDNN